MEPLNLEQQINRQIEKGCVSKPEVIRDFLRTTSYYVLNHDYEKYLKLNKSIQEFKVKDYKWLEETNEKVSKEALSIVLRSERVIRNLLADKYSFFCRENNLDFFSVDSFNVSTPDFHDALNTNDKDKLKRDFISDCWELYLKKKKKLHQNYHCDKINDVPPFVIAQHLTFGQIRTFFKLLHKSVKEEIATYFNLRIAEFNSITEKLNYLRNTCAHGEFILDFQTLKPVQIRNNTYHKYCYHDKYILNRNRISFVPILSLCSYFLKDNIKFFLSTMRNIFEISNYNNKGSINSEILYKRMGLTINPKNLQPFFR